MRLLSFPIAIILTILRAQRGVCSNLSKDECVLFNTGDLSPVHNSKFVFAFGITKECLNSKINRIVITNTSSYDRTPENYCYFITDGPSCLSSSPEKYCFCSNQRGREYVIEKQVTELSEIRWRIKGKSSKEDVFDVPLNVHVRDPPTITNLAVFHNNVIFHNHERVEVSQNSNVTIQCSWEHGNPPMNARLSRDGSRLPATELTVSGERSRLLRIVMQNLQCSDSGVIACEADGANRNLSVQLDVQCDEVSLPESLSTSMAVVNTAMGEETHTSTPSSPAELDVQERDSGMVLYISFGGGALLLIIAMFFVGVFFQRKVLAYKSEQHLKPSIMDPEALEMRPLPPLPDEAGNRNSITSYNSNIYQEIKDNARTQKPTELPDDYLNPVASVGDPESNPDRSQANVSQKGVPDLALQEFGPPKPHVHRSRLQHSSPKAARSHHDVASRDASETRGLQYQEEEEGAVGGVGISANKTPLFYASGSCIFPDGAYPREFYEDRDPRFAKSKRATMSGESYFEEPANTPLWKRRKRSALGRQKRSLQNTPKRLLHPPYPEADELDDIPPLPQRTKPLWGTEPSQSIACPTLSEGLDVDPSQGFERNAALSSILEDSDCEDLDGYMKHQPAVNLTTLQAGRIDVNMPKHNPTLLTIGNTSAKAIRTTTQLKVPDTNTTNMKPCSPRCKLSSAARFLSSAHQPSLTLPSSDYENTQSPSLCTWSTPGPTILQTGTHEDIKYQGEYMNTGKSQQDTPLNREPLKKATSAAGGTFTSSFALAIPPDEMSFAHHGTTVIMDTDLSLDSCPTAVSSFDPPYENFGTLSNGTK